MDDARSSLEIDCSGSLKRHYEELGREAPAILIYCIYNINTKIILTLSLSESCSEMSYRLYSKP